MKIIISAVVALLTAQSASAEQRSNKTFSTVNGRTVVGAPAAAPARFIKVTPGGGTGANVVSAPAPAPAAAPAQALGIAAGGDHAMSGSGRTAARGTRGVQRRSGKSFGSGKTRKLDGDGAPTNTEERPPNFDKPGALIRTTGHRLPEYEKPSGERGAHTVDAGEIVLNPKKAYNVAQAPSIQPGPRDTPPPPNPGTSTRSTNGGASANAPVSGSGGSGGNGGNNNGNGNNGNPKPGDDYDPHPRPTLDDAVNSAY